VLAFWRVSTRSENVQVTCSHEDHLDYFVSHVWQPPGGFTNVDLYAQQKVQALEMFGRREAMLGGPTGDSPEPWFVLSSAEYARERELGNRDPGDDWRSYTCWVDKACAHSVLAPRSDLENTSAELIRSTKSAISNCRVFTAVLYWHFFSRLWCVMEWATFLADAAPDYRRARLVIHEELLQNRNWDRITESVLAFSLSTLRSGNDQDHPELWQDLEALMVSSLGFERFIQVTAYALLVRYLLLRCTRHCLAFGTDSDCTRKWNTIIDSCKKLKLNGLARGLGSARPKHWWQLASRRAKEQLEGKAFSTKDCSQSPSFAGSVPMSPRSPKRESRSAAGEDPAKKADRTETRRFSALDALALKLESMAQAHKTKPREEGVQLPRGAVNRESVAAASKAMETLKARAACKEIFNPGTLTRNIVQEKLANLSKNTNLSKHSEELAPPKGENQPSPAPEPVPAGQTPHEPAPPGPAPHESSPPGQTLHEPHLPQEFQDAGEDHVAAMQQVMGGLPDGFSPFWRGATGHLLTDADRIRARVFLQAWRNYREYVNRWFDKYICPHIEVWRQRGIRARGLLEETFGNIFMNVDGAFQMSLCNQLAPGLIEKTMAAEPPPRGRPGRPCQAPWSNPTLDRLLVVGTGKGNDYPGSLGAGKQDKKAFTRMRTSRVSFCGESELQSEKFKAPEPPTILLSPLGLELSGLSTHVLLQLTCGDGSDAQTVQLPQRLGVEALNNAFKQLLHGAQQRQHAQITKLELEAIIPRTMLKVPGSDHARLNLGMRLVGTLCAKLATAGNRPHSSTPALSDGDISPGMRSFTPPPGSMSSPDDTNTVYSSEEDVIDGITIDWKMWECRSIVESAEAAFAAEVAEVLNSDGLSPSQQRQLLQQKRAEMDKKKGIDVNQKQMDMNKKQPVLPVSLGSEQTTSLQTGYPYSSPGLTPRRDRALASLYVNYSDDPTSTCISPRRPQVAALNPLSKSLLEKARSKLGLTADESGDDSLATRPRRTPRRVAGPGGMLPATAVPCPRQFPQMAELTARAASPTLRMKTLQALQPINEHARRTPEEELVEKRCASAQAPAQEELIDLISRWEWAARGHGGPPEAARHVHWTGTMQEIFNKLDEWVATARRSGCPYCVPVNDGLVSDAKGGGGALLPTVQSYGSLWQSEQDDGASTLLLGGSEAMQEKPAPPPLARAPACSRCNHTDVANVSLEQSMLRSIWETPSCSICLHCGLVTPLPPERASEHRALDGDTVLEVTTSIMLKAGAAESMQQHILRVLRIDHGTVNIAAPASDLGMSVSAAKTSVAYICFTTRTTGSVAAAACSHKHRPQARMTRMTRSSVRYSAIAQERPVGLFNRDLDWAQGSLADTGLDMVYGMSKQIPINFAIGELDDRRTLPRRKDVCPLVLWAELGHVLSPDFDPNKWIQATMEVCSTGHFSLPGAIMLRTNTVKLRKAIIAATPYKRDAEDGSYHDEPISWPLALHRVLVARSGTEDGVMSVALSGSGVKASSPSELFQSGRTALARMHESGRKTTSIARPSVVGKTINAMYAFDQGKPSGGKVVDAGMVMHELVHRRESGDASVGERALLRARRVLRHIQVVEFLDAWYDKLTDADADWRLTQKESDGFDRNHHEDDDELVEDEEKSDDSDSEEEGESVENLILQKVLGHIKEYVHHADVALKAWTVINVIVQTCSKFCESEVMKRGRRGEKETHIEHKVLDQGFVRTAMRTLYRHHHRPEICEEVFVMLRHLVKPGHGCGPRTIAELSSPPTNAFTFIMSLCHFSEAERIGLVSDNIRLLNLLFAKEHAQAPPPLPEGREEEAAENLIPILYRHQTEMTIVMSILDLFTGMARNSEMCCAFFAQGLTEMLRRWLLDSREGKHLVLWVKVKEAAGQIAKSEQRGATGRAADDFRKRATALKSLQHQVATCETACWELICTLTNGSTHCEGFLEDAQKTIVYGLQEMKHRPRSRQWLHATQCLTKIVLHDTDVHASRLIAAGCLDAICAEFPDGEVKEVMPLLIALLDKSHELGVPRRQPGESDDEDESGTRASTRESILQRVRRSHFHHKTVGIEAHDMAISEDSFSSDEEGQERKPHVSTKGLGGAGKRARRILQFSAAMKRYKPEAADLTDAAELPKPVMIDKSIQWLIAHQFVQNALKAMRTDYGEFTCQVRMKLLRVLAEIFIPRYTADKEEVDQLYLQSRTAVSEFENFGDEYGGGLLMVLEAFKAHLDDAELVDTALFLLLGAFDMFQRVAERAADVEGLWEIVVHAAWKHCKEAKTRRRALLVLRKMREAKPMITNSISSLWKEKWAAFGSEENTNQKMSEPRPTKSRHSFASVAVESLAKAPRRSTVNGLLSALPILAELKRPPGDMVRFGAVLRVHAYYLEHGNKPLTEALEPLDQYINDWEICAVALTGITLGSKMEMENRFKALAKVPDFALMMRRAVEIYTDPSAFRPVLQLVTGVLGTNPKKKDELIETSALACRVALENLEDKQYNNEPSWLNADSWEKFLEAAEAAGRSPGGKEVFARHEIREILNDVWLQVEASDKDEDRSVVKLHKGQTVFVMELLG